MATLREKLEDCQSAATCSNTPFNKWELDFLDSITEQWEERGSLTEKQMDVLDKIWDKI